MIKILVEVSVPDGTGLGTMADVFEAANAFVSEMESLADVEATWSSASGLVAVSSDWLPTSATGNGAHLGEAEADEPEEIAASPVTKRGSGKGVRYGAQDPDALRVAVLAEMRRLAVTVDGVEYAPSTQRWDAGRRDGLPTSAGVCKRLGKRWTELCGAAGLAMNRTQMAHVIGEAKADSSGADDAPEEDFR